MEEKPKMPDIRKKIAEIQDFLYEPPLNDPRKCPHCYWSEEDINEDFEVHMADCYGVIKERATKLAMILSKQNDSK